MITYIACDHAGFKLKQALMEPDYKDLGTYDDQAVDYVDYAKKLCEIVYGGMKGILICGSGIGMCMAANRYRHIRAALCVNEEMAFLARSHNYANVLCLGARLTTIEQAQKIVKKFMETQFSNEERHLIRIEKLWNLKDC